MADDSNVKALPNDDAAEIVGRLREVVKAAEDPTRQPIGFAVVIVHAGGGSYQSYYCGGARGVPRMQLLGALHILMDELLSHWRG